VREARRERSRQEVRAILRDLQRIASETGEASEVVAPEPREARESVRPGGGRASVFAALAHPAVAGGVALAVLALLILAAVPFWRTPAKLPGLPVAESAAPAPNADMKDGNPAVPEPSRAAPEALPPLPSGDVLKDARRLMAEGQVLTAREALLKAADPPSADVALAIARSYDPTFLRSVPAPDAEADVTEAERWYRRWREIAVKDGVVMDEERLQRILRAMR